MKKIHPDDLICMDNHPDARHYRVELTYARDDNFLFGERIYRKEAKLYLHKMLGDIVIQAATRCMNETGLRFVLYDGLRTCDAQERMTQTQRVRDNPQWLEEPRLLSPAGAGGHPRAMAIDIGLETQGGVLLDMGTPFDFLAANPHPDHNPAHRAYIGHNDIVMKNRQILDFYMIEAAKSCETPLFPLPQEWWDYRLPAEIYEQYAPLYDADLPAHMRLIDI